MKILTVLFLASICFSSQIANSQTRKVSQPSSSQNKFYANLCSSRFSGDRAAECLGAIGRLVKAHPELTPASVALRVCAHQSDRATATDKNELDCLYKAKADIEQMQKSVAEKIGQALKFCQKESMDMSKDSPCIKLAFQRVAVQKKPISSSFQARN